MPEQREGENMITTFGVLSLYIKKGTSGAPEPFSQGKHDTQYFSGAFWEEKHSLGLQHLFHWTLKQRVAHPKPHKHCEEG